MAQEVEALAIKHFAGTRTALLARRYEPLFEIDEVSGEVLWEAWAAGFVAGLELNANAWTGSSPPAGRPPRRPPACCCSA